MPAVSSVADVDFGKYVLLHCRGRFQIPITWSAFHIKWNKYVLIVKAEVKTYLPIHNIMIHQEVHIYLVSDPAPSLLLQGKHCRYLILLMCLVLTQGDILRNKWCDYSNLLKGNLLMYSSSCKWGINLHSSLETEDMQDVHHPAAHSSFGIPYLMWNSCVQTCLNIS